jgi:hypothetical protein
VDFMRRISVDYLNTVSLRMSGTIERAMWRSFVCSRKRTPGSLSAKRSASTCVTDNTVSIAVFEHLVMAIRSLSLRKSLRRRPAILFRATGQTLVSLRSGVAVTL